MLLKKIRFEIGKTPAAILFCLCFILCYFTTINWVLPTWLNPRGFYGHSLLVFFLVGHLLWRDRGVLLSLTPRPSNALYIGIFFSSFLWLLAWAANVIIIQVFAAYLVFLAGLCSIFGKRSYLIIVPILGLLLFTLPIWQPIQFLLQNIATYIVQIMLNTFGIAVFVEKNLINIPNGVFEIEGGCSGVGFILVSLSLTGYLALLDRLNLLRGFKFLLIGAALALFANWVRIFLIILIGYYDGMDNPIVGDHVAFGWVVYSLVFFPFLYLSNNSSQPKSPSAPTNIAKKTGLQSNVFLMTLILSFTLPAMYPALTQLEDLTPDTNYTPPTRIGSFNRKEGSATWNPNYPKANNTLLSRYVDPNTGSFHLFVANYLKQQQGTEVIHINNTLYDKNYELVSKNIVKISNKDLKEATTIVLKKSDGEFVSIMYWYKIGDRYAPTESNAKILQIQQKLLGKSNASIIAVLTSCTDSRCNNAQKIFNTLPNFL